MATNVHGINARTGPEYEAFIEGLYRYARRERTRIARERVRAVS